MEQAEFSQLVFEVNSKLPQEVIDKKSRKAKPKVRFEMGRVESHIIDAEIDEGVQEERVLYIDAALVRCARTALNFTTDHLGAPG
jgi:hypothetical protein